MAIEVNLPITDAEREKFTRTDGNEVAVRTKIDGALEGSFSVTGLSKEGKITEVTIASSGWTPLPLNSLTDRNAMSIQNYSDEEIKLNYDPNESDYVGITMLPKTERYYDITDGITIYAKSKSATAVITVEELA